ncbi:MAG: HYR domain-containing protein [Saprospiraceae bacterium]
MNRYLFLLLFGAACCSTDLKAQTTATSQSNVQTNFFLQLDLERGYVLCPTGTGNLYLAGMRNVDMVLIEMTPEANIVSSRYIDVGNTGLDAISNLIVDSEGNLVITGNLREDSLGNGYIFRYDPTLRKTLWAKIFGGNQSLVHGVLENGPGGNFLVYANVNTAASSDTEFFQLERGTGNMVPGTAWRYTAGSAINFHAMTMHNGSLYATGYYADGTQFNGTRHLLAQINPNTGAVVWSRLGHIGPNTDARLYGNSITAQGAAVVAAYSGNRAFNDLGQTRVYLQKSTIDGAYVWHKEYDFTQWADEWAEEVVNLPDGYMVYGRKWAANELFLMKIDLFGNLLWVRKFKHESTTKLITTAQGQMVAMGSFVFATGFSNNGPGVEHSFVLKNDSKGTTAPTCPIYQQTPVLTTHIPEQENWVIMPTAIASPTLLFDMPVAPPVNFNLQKQVICQEVVNDCLGLPDTHFSDTVICPGETLTYAVPGYDTYLWAPAAGLSCTTCPTVTASPQTTTTYTLFASDANGCELLDTFTVSVRTAPVLELGPDVILCENKTVVFDAGPGFVSYLWHDGSTAPTLTAVDPGTYRVEVADQCGKIQRDSVFFSFSLLPDTRFGDTVICPGKSVTFSLTGFTTYTWAPAAGLSCTTCPTVTASPQTTTTYTLFASDANGCELRDTFTVSVLSGPSSLKITCPPNQTVQTAPGAQTAVATYADPATSSDCPCAPPVWTRTQGLASGALFPVGPTLVCYMAEDGCNTTASCCFTVTVTPTLDPNGDPCDVKETPCVRFEILGISQNAKKQKTYRMRVINKCPNEMQYVAYQLPNGMTAKAPADGSVYTAPSGRKYEVRNAASYQSVRFKSTGPGIANGQSDVFEYTLPAQADPVFIHVTVRLAPQVFVETHLNVFGCVVQTANRPDDEGIGTENRSGESWTGEQTSTLHLYPNPATDILFADLGDWADQPVRLLVTNALGRAVLDETVSQSGRILTLDLPAGWASGVYVLTLTGPNGGRRSGRFVR